MDYKKYVFIPAAPEEVYLALTKPMSIELWTGGEVEFEEKAGTEFSLWDGDISGKNLAFEYGKKIEQEWYFGDQELKSIVTIKIHAEKTGTSLEFRQTNIPDDDFEEFTEGLEENYFAGLIDFFEQ